jgi:hypothetical protein
MTNQQVILVQRPEGKVDANTTKLVEVRRPVCGPDEALIKVGTLSIDPTIRTWMNDAPGYRPAVGFGAVSVSWWSRSRRTTRSATWSLE